MAVGVRSSAGCRIERLESRVLASASDFDVTLGQGGARSLSFRLSTGYPSIVQHGLAESDEHVTVTFSGPGSAVVGVDAPGAVEKAGRDGNVVLKVPEGVGLGPNVHLSSIICTGTTPQSVLRIMTSGSDPIPCGPITVHGSLKSIVGAVELGQPGVSAQDPTSLVKGDITADGTIGQITLGQIQDGTIIIRGNSASLSLCVGNIDQESVISAAPIKLLKTYEWTNIFNAADFGSLSAPSIGKIILPRDPFNYGFYVNINTGSIGAVTGRDFAIAGNWNAGDVGAISVGTAIAGLPWSLHARNVGAVSFSHANLKANYPTDGFVIAADSIGMLDLGQLSVHRGGAPFGVTSHQIIDLSFALGSKKIRLNNLTSEAQLMAALSAQSIDTANFHIQIN